MRSPSAASSRRSRSRSRSPAVQGRPRSWTPSPVLGVPLQPLRALAVGPQRARSPRARSGSFGRPMRTLSPHAAAPRPRSRSLQGGVPPERFGRRVVRPEAPDPQYDRYMRPRGPSSGSSDDGRRLVRIRPRGQPDRQQQMRRLRSEDRPRCSSASLPPRRREYSNSLRPPPRRRYDLSPLPPLSPVRSGGHAWGSRSPSRRRERSPPMRGFTRRNDSRTRGGGYIAYPRRSPSRSMRRRLPSRSCSRRGSRANYNSYSNSGHSFRDRGDWRSGGDWRGNSDWNSGGDWRNQGGGGGGGSRWRDRWRDVRDESPKREEHENKPQAASRSRSRGESSAQRGKDDEEEEGRDDRRDRRWSSGWRTTRAKPEGCKTVWVGWLKEKPEEKDIVEFFKDCGVVTETRISDGNTKGFFAHVTFETTESVDLAANKAGTEFMGGVIYLDYAYMDKVLADGAKTGASRRYRPKSIKPPGGHTLWVGDVSMDATEQDLIDLFTPCGQIEAICLRENQLKNGQFGHIKFIDTESVDKAVELAGSLVKGVPVRVDFAEDKPGFMFRLGRDGVGQEKPEGCRTLWVGGLPKDADEEAIRALFEKCGEIKSIQVGRSKFNDNVFAHIEFLESSSVDEGVKLKGHRMNGSKIMVKFAENRGSDGKPPQHPQGPPMDAQPPNPLPHAYVQHPWVPPYGWHPGMPPPRYHGWHPYSGYPPPSYPPPAYPQLGYGPPPPTYHQPVLPGQAALPAPRPAAPPPGSWEGVREDPAPEAPVLALEDGACSSSSDSESSKDQEKEDLQAPPGNFAAPNATSDPRVPDYRHTAPPVRPPDPHYVNHYVPRGPAPVAYPSLPVYAARPPIANV